MYSVKIKELSQQIAAGEYAIPDMPDDKSQQKTDGKGPDDTIYKEVVEKVNSTLAKDEKKKTEDKSEKTKTEEKPKTEKKEEEKKSEEKSESKSKSKWRGKEGLGPPEGKKQKD